ncbi:PREDICTED: myb-like protein X [Drosophila arizonae]|uniref:Myb-like protein X n=1 Tax=Drosophila arizonae TaxID=7263 RepID=A0ABM1PRY2_DROAR|nr:PREDICTED: myb-like protein X [Drosophila arizonae]
MLLQSIFAPLWQPVKDQLGLFRALATGGRIPGTNLILMPVAAGKCRFGFMEHFMMALAGAWLLFCVIYRELKDVKPTKRQQQHQQPCSMCCIAWNEKDTDTDTETTITTTTTTTTITTTTTADTGTSSPTEDTANQTDENEETIDGQLMIDTDGVLGDGTEAIFYWGCHQLHRPEPIFRFTRLQLEKMLRMDQDESDDDYEDDSDDDIVPDSDDKVDDSQSNSNRDKEDKNLDNYESINEKQTNIRYQ